MTPVGTWRIVDDQAQQATAYLVIVERDGLLWGHIDELLRPSDRLAVCRACKDDLKNQPILGLEIVRHAKKAEGEDVWDDASLLSPETGEFYALRMRPVDGGQQLEMDVLVDTRWRTQAWQRVK
ncbi:DUF2147 domain-containing protein [Ottowia sp.]|uniref:DUF2147 domain-containing protein n=1 Tax=Ottowia sp. TaxID=1898956 RepID=UPI003A868357